MANSISFDTTYTGGQVSTGAYASQLGVTTYSGTSVLTSDTSYTVDGTVSAVGSTVSVTRNTAGAVSVASSATYEGYFSVGGSTFYVFTDPTLLGVGGAFVVSSTGAPVSLSGLQDITAGVPTPVCFLGGTTILTSTGEIAVEALRSGDMVAALRDGVIGFEPVRWIGHGAAKSASTIHDTDHAPVRIKQDAIGNNIPARDLLVTPEHCLFLDNVLIPARMLVNNGSIVSEIDHGDYDFFHVELDRHAILIANGVEAESYLDTGNRANFHNHDVAALRADFTTPRAQSWMTHAAAPLAVDRETVEPIWNRLAERARSLGFDIEAATTGVAADADLALRIVTDAGQEILPTLSDERVYAFVVPPGSGALRLRSRSGRPSDLVGPFLDDRRTLGVQIGRIGVGSAARRDICDAHLTADHLPGWHAAEADHTRRWTDGNALLPVDAATGADTLFLDIEVVGVGPYRAAVKAA